MSSTYDLLKTILLKRRSKKSRKKIDLSSLEWEISEQSNDYMNEGGYYAFYIAIQRLEEESILTPLQKKSTNGRSPSLNKYYWLLPATVEPTWSKLQFLQVEDLLNLAFYHDHPEYQTDEEWKRILTIYQFMKNRESRRYVSVPERSLELFGDEKAITKSKLGTVTRLGLNLQDLKAVSHGEPFVSWLKPGTELKGIQNILIVENLSFYHTAIQLQLENRLNREYQLIIYGEGNKINKSFSFMYHMYPEGEHTFYYCGDMDPEGFNIFSRLANSYDVRFTLAEEFYVFMVKKIECANSYTDQVENVINRNHFLSFAESHKIEETVMKLWHKRKRIPQEVITVESW
ncbi:permease [Halalkalibacillus sediminis]|uniref:Permease n=1 Tax=Halalkalibacillus sediminis TaxID=2018042 RepID=A0A2I0QU20_9BACI|nr:Wadjet anti-phage system protein JetD domain-containing protein [Halalkalibacillus sediminis]PKR77831.1 permease [Halalkalibacillus sediminis]